MNEIVTVFENEDFGSVRTIMIDGHPWFVGKDICLAFGDKNSSRSIGRVDSEDKQIIEIVDSLGRNQNATFVNESGLYSLLFAMQPQKANRNGVSDAYLIEIQKRIDRIHKFKHWVTSEVLPAIRKTGMYGKMDSYMIDDPVERAKRWIEEQEEKLALERKVEEDKPKVAFADHVADTSDLIDINTLAKLAKDENIRIGQKRLFKWLRDKKYLMSDEKHKNQPYQRYIDNGLFEVKEYTFETPYTTKIGHTTYVTGKGQITIIEKLREDFS